jgi:hypothetical protein
VERNPAIAALPGIGTRSLASASMPALLGAGTIGAGLANPAHSAVEADLPNFCATTGTMSATGPPSRDSIRIKGLHIYALFDSAENVRFCRGWCVVQGSLKLPGGLHRLNS